ncbi:MAG: hypothetical protein CME62_07505 [Halobacteriovoraceae bacterium]|nr:hypothetical protein [Halobacteriovoraceae bacterium]|tara:strand:+ start:11078 stop:11359 length:282 start_codon:yes stop_codon:yes gene_type:complete
MSNDSKVKVIDVNTQQVLFECEFKDIEKAYQYASDMEDMGLDIKLISPTITESLCDSLGIDYERRADYEQSVVAEIEDHDGSCCAKPEDEKLQ